MSRMRFGVAALMSLMMMTSLVWSVTAHAKDDEHDVAKATDRIESARSAYEELVNSPDRGVPDYLLKNCKAIAIFPGVIKAAVGVGARHGHGVVMVRGGNGEWSPPAFLTMTGGSWGLQLGVDKTDVVLFFMSDKSLNSLLASKTTLGASAGLAAGPVGRTAEAGTDLKLNSEIYSYARSKGLYAGIALNGARVAPDKEAIEDFYGQRIDARKILMDRDVPAGHAGAYESLQRVLPS